MSLESAAPAGAFAWPQVGEQLPKLSCESADGDALIRYARASGDDNPLHIDLAIAQRAGLQERPIHGMLMVGYFEPAIFAWRSDLVLTHLATKFLRPVLAGQKFEISGRVVLVAPEKSPSIVMRLMAHGFGGDKPGGDLAVLAEAQLRPRT